MPSVCGQVRRLPINEVHSRWPVCPEFETSARLRVLVHSGVSMDTDQVARHVGSSESVDEEQLHDGGDDEEGGWDAMDDW